MHFSSDKDIAAVVRDYVRKGWRFTRGKRHGKLISPDGKRVIVPGTPSDRRARSNFLGDLRRTYG